MNKESFLNVMNYLGIAYNKEITPEIVKLWYGFFKDYDEETFKNAIYQIISVEKFFPSIAMVKEMIASQNNSNLSLSAEEEWSKVIDSVRKYGMYQEEEALNSLNEITRNVMKRIGYKELCLADENRKYNLRSAFLKAFENEKNDIKTYLALENSKLSDNKQLENIRNRATITDAITSMANTMRLSNTLNDEDESEF